MNTTITTQLKTHTDNINLAHAFAKSYPRAVDLEDSFFYSFNDKLHFQIRDAAIAGEVFGKNGWTRKRDPYASKITYHWKREIDSVIVQIEAAEVMEDMNDVPVPPKAFPIALQEASV